MQYVQLFTHLVGQYLVRLKLKGLHLQEYQAQTLDSFTPELASLFRTLFTAVFGRRLGTVDDGTTLQESNPQTDAETISKFDKWNKRCYIERINTVRVGVTREHLKLEWEVH